MPDGEIIIPLFYSGFFCTDNFFKGSPVIIYNHSMAKLIYWFYSQICLLILLQ